MSTATALPTSNLVSTALLEREIRAQAHAVITEIVNRRDHPSYGYTKTGIRERSHRLRGIIGLYAVITGQASHTEVSPVLVTFQDESTRSVVNTALNAVNNLKDSK